MPTYQSNPTEGRDEAPGQKKVRRPPAYNNQTLEGGRAMQHN